MHFLQWKLLNFSNNISYNVVIGPLFWLQQPWGMVKLYKSVAWREVEYRQESQFWSKFFENHDFGRNLRKILILVEICENLDFGRNFRKILNWVEILENVDLCWNLRKISVLVEILDNLDFGRNLRKISVLVEICEKSRFWWKFLEISILAIIF